MSNDFAPIAPLDVPSPGELPVPPTAPAPPPPSDPATPDPFNGGGPRAAPSSFGGGGADPGPSVAFARYDPRTGRYVGPDGKLYQQSDLATSSAPKKWQDLFPT